MASLSLQAGGLAAAGDFYLLQQPAEVKTTQCVWNIVMLPQFFSVGGTEGQKALKEKKKKKKAGMFEIFVSKRFRFKWSSEVMLRCSVPVCAGALHPSELSRDPWNLGAGLLSTPTLSSVPSDPPQPQGRDETPDLGSSGRYKWHFVVFQGGGMALSSCSVLEAFRILRLH